MRGMLLPPGWLERPHGAAHAGAIAVMVLAGRVTPPQWHSVAVAPAWAWLGGLLGATMVISGIVIAPRLGAAGYVTAMTVGTVTASMTIDHFGLVGFAAHPVSTLRLVGGGLVIAGMILVQSN